MSVRHDLKIPPECRHRVTGPHEWYPNGVLSKGEYCPGPSPDVEELISIVLQWLAETDGVGALARVDVDQLRTRLGGNEWT